MSNLKRFLALTLAMLMVVGAMAVSAKSFTDVATSAPYAEAVDVLSELGVIAGTSTDEFSPDALVERQQMAMFIARLATAQPSWFAVEADAVFADQTDAGYNAAIAYASTNGFVKGTDTVKNLFDGTASVTLQEAATMLCRVLGYTTDAMNKAYPMSYLTMADDVGLLNKLEDIAPTAALTRGEVAIMLYNAFKAPMATTYLSSNSAGGVIVNVSIPDDLTKAKTLMQDKWKVAKVSSYIAATKDFRFSGSSVKTSKTLTDPVKLNNVADQLSFATIAKFFPENAVANDYLGVDLNVFIRNGKIISIDVLGEKLTTKAATWNNDTKTITVEGTSYDLDAYPVDAKYPSETDNCFYTYIDSVITKIDGPAKVADVANGFFSIEILNSGKETQKIIFKPYKLGKVIADGSDADTTIEIEGVGNITRNTATAVVDNYVVYFNGGSNYVETIAVATKSAAAKVVALNNTTKVATFDNGVKAPFNTAPIPGHGILTSLSIDGSYYVYTVNGVVVKTESVSAPAYTPKAYAIVLAKTGDSFDGFRLKVLTNKGETTVVKVEKIDGVSIIGTAPDGCFVVTGGAHNYLVGDIIVLDGTNILTYDNAGFKASTTEFFEYNDEETDSLTATNSNIITINGINVVLADFSKVIVNNNGTFTSYSGKNFKGIVGTATTFFSVIRPNGVNELAYLYVEGVPAQDVTAPDSLYVFVSQGDVTSTTVAYNAINLATGAKEVITFTNASGTSSIIGATYGAATLVYNIKAINTVPTAYTSTNMNSFKVLENGYISTVDSKIYSTNGTKYYVWNVDTSTYDVKAFGDIDKTRFNSGIVVFDANNNASYVVIGGQAVLANTVSKSITSNTVTLSATNSPDKIYYSLNGGTSYTEYTAPFAITATVTAKVYTAKAGYANSAVAELTLTYTPAT